jgi:5-methylcytosine-specific restriction endonuclease McrA
MRKHKIEEVKQYFKDNDCVLLSDKYISVHSLLDYICDCGNKSKINFHNFKQGQRCKKCAIDKRRKKLILTYKQVEDIFKEGGCMLKSDKYIGANSPLVYICGCGNISKISVANFKNGRRCKDCGSKKSAEKQKFNMEYVKNYFAERNCEMIDDFYINSGTPINYRCVCGNADKIAFDHFKVGQRCKGCWVRRNTGKNNHSYNQSLTDEDREDRRLIYGYKKWVKDIYKRDNYVCVLCSNKKKINAHHIEGYAENKELRLEVNNGVTLCQTCHNKFHKKYSKKNNNQDQFNEFMKIGSAK